MYAEGQVGEIVLGLESAEGNAPSAEDTVKRNKQKGGKDGMGRKAERREESEWPEGSDHSTISFAYGSGN